MFPIQLQLVPGSAVSAATVLLLKAANWSYGPPWLTAVQVPRGVLQAKQLCQAAEVMPMLLDALPTALELTTKPARKGVMGS